MKKIALPVISANKIDDHFGHCEKYAIYTVSDQNEIVGVEELESEQGCGCKSNIAGTLAKMGVSEMLAGGIGNGAVNVLANSGIKVVRGCSGNASDVVKEFLSGKIFDSGINCVQHEHHHDEGHQCSHH
jgi:predicted Fe-Mo cluster-binding NifX family protein